VLFNTSYFAFDKVERVVLNAFATMQLCCLIFAPLAINPGIAFGEVDPPSRDFVILKLVCIDGIRGPIFFGLTNPTLH
jgi:hypothetical protein